MIFILQTHLSKGAQKNMVKAWNFGGNLPKILPSKYS